MKHITKTGMYLDRHQIVEIYIPSTSKISTAIVLHTTFIPGDDYDTLVYTLYTPGLLFTAESYKTSYLDDDYSVEPPELIIADVFSPIAFSQEILNTNIPSLDILLG